MNNGSGSKFSKSLLIGRLSVFAAAAAVLYEGALEFYNVAWGTGAWIGAFSARWGLAFLAFLIMDVLCLMATGAILWRLDRINISLIQLVIRRTRMGAFRWLAAALVLAAPVLFLQFSPWGVVFGKSFIRLLLWALAILLAAFFITSDSTRMWTWPAILTAVVISGAGFALGGLLGGVTDYPFALSWSEGNRLWDYSLMFGKRLYVYSPGNPPTAYLDFGRQLVGGLPFLLPHVSAWAERLWVAVTNALPYLLLGYLAFRPAAREKGASWILAGTWSFIFLNQGPIHTPLVVCAILVAIAWGQTFWLAIPLVAISGYFAQISRFTWMFAPAIWAVELELGGAHLDGGRIPSTNWRRAVVLGSAGLVGSGLSLLPGLAPGGVNLETVTSASTKQALLWYKLFPNATYGYGILLGLLIAAGPLLAVLIYLAASRWRLSLLQKLALSLPLLAFLVVGLIVSTKIGGGGDLHNLDMFLIGLLFAAALAWRAGGAAWLGDIRKSTIWMQTGVLLLIAIPAFQPLMSLRPLSFAKDASWLAVLADVQKPKDLGSLPSDQAVIVDLQKLRAGIQSAQAQGDVLFMDQRQLLTFGYIQNTRLVPEYEKKLMMDEALSQNSSYFHAFYQDLASHRFSLIISDPLRTPIKDSEYGFGEENNAWVKWVAKPILCYYDEKDTLADVRVELLTPRQGPVDCATVLP